MESDYAEGYGYVRDEESATRSHEDYESEEKQSIDLRDEKYVDQYVVINRTRPEVCDKEVREDRLR